MTAARISLWLAVGIAVGNGADVGGGVAVGAETVVGIVTATAGCADGVCADGAQPATTMLNRARRANALGDLWFIVNLLELPQRWAT